jgi:hypothetical protein
VTRSAIAGIGQTTKFGAPLEAYDPRTAEQAMIGHLHNGLAFWKREYRNLVAQPINWDF